MNQCELCQSPALMDSKLVCVDCADKAIEQFVNQSRNLFNGGKISDYSPKFHACESVKVNIIVPCDNNDAI